MFIIRQKYYIAVGNLIVSSFSDLDLSNDLDQLHHLVIVISLLLDYSFIDMNLEC